MATGLHHQMTFLARLVQLNARGDDVLVPAFEPEVLPPELGDEVGQAIGGDGVGHDGAAGMLPQGDGRHEGDEAVAVGCGPQGMGVGSDEGNNQDMDKGITQDRFRCAASSPRQTLERSAFLYLLISRPELSTMADLEDSTWMLYNCFIFDYLPKSCTGQGTPTPFAPASP